MPLPARPNKPGDTPKSAPKAASRKTRAAKKTLPSGVDALTASNAPSAANTKVSVNAQITAEDPILAAALAEGPARTRKKAPVAAVLLKSAPAPIKPAAQVESKPTKAAPKSPVNAEKTVSKPASKAAAVAQKAAGKEDASAVKAVEQAVSSAAKGVSKTVTNTKKPLAKRDSKEPKKLFVLDTNVLLHDPTCLFRFEEHDIFLPMITLEELDHQKKGLSEVARNARQVSRSLDALVKNHGNKLQEPIALNSLGNKEASGHLYFQTGPMQGKIDSIFTTHAADHMILSVLSSLQASEKRPVILVSKDINIRLKALMLSLAAEDYLTDYTPTDDELVHTGMVAVEDDFFDGADERLEEGKRLLMLHTEARFSPNTFLHTPSGLVALVRESGEQLSTFEVVRNYRKKKNAVWGISARNLQQNCALNLLMNPDIDFVTILGQAGTGKTLLTLAAALTQVLETRRYSEIIVTRPTVSVGEEIGFLPGSEEEKMQPWMGALVDNMEFLTQRTRQSEEPWMQELSLDALRHYIKVKSMSFMRGRTFFEKFIIIDEAQNLTPKEMKTLITRAGMGTKIVCLGNIAQIDTPYVTEGSSGLTYAVNHFKSWAHAGHITLAKGERSRLADFANDHL